MRLNLSTGSPTLERAASFDLECDKYPRHRSEKDRKGHGQDRRVDATSQDTQGHKPDHCRRQHNEPPDPIPTPGPDRDRRLGRRSPSNALEHAQTGTRGTRGREVERGHSSPLGDCREVKTLPESTERMKNRDHEARMKRENRRQTGNTLDIEPGEIHEPSHASIQRPPNENHQRPGQSELHRGCHGTDRQGELNQEKSRQHTKHPRQR